MSIINNMPIKIGGKNYQLLKGSVTLTANASSSQMGSTVITMPYKIAAVFFNVTGTRQSNGYYADPESIFFEGYDSLWNSTYPSSSPSCYFRMDSSYYSQPSKIDRYSFKLIYNTNNGTTFHYIAILELE